MRAVIQRPSSHIRGFDNVACEVTLQPVPEFGSRWQRVLALKTLEVIESAQDLPVLHRGYFDSHLHLRWLGELRSSPDFSNCRDLASFEKLLRKALEARLPIVQGFAWDEGQMGTTLKELEGVFARVIAELAPQQQVLLARVDGHSALVSPALIKKFTLPTERLWVSDKILFDIYHRLPPVEPARLRAQILAAQTELTRLGVSAVGDMSLDAHSVGGLLSLAESGELLIDVVGVMDLGRVPVIEERGPHRAQSAVSSPYLARPAEVTLGYVKKFLDGSFGSRTAWLSQPYLDAETFGESLIKTNEALAQIKPLIERGFRLSVHAIGDAAVDQALEIGDVIGRMTTPGQHHRIEHAQLLRDDQLRRLHEQGLWTLHVQPGHRAADAHFIGSRLGQERFEKEAYRLKTLAEQGLSFCLGSDAPIDRDDPETVLQIATQGLAAKECLNRDAAVWSLTVKPRLLEGLAYRPLEAGSLACVTPPGIG